MESRRGSCEIRGGTVPSQGLGDTIQVYGD
ncbi:hypothetical protein POX_c04667 [Penicillium oxalicum]|nr:hypothetical protein POX_c04667 [Penicillium oxalicum]KAI2791788.1 hypothetical protein POX_c04667 [Penicillium oxalicum]